MDRQQSSKHQANVLISFRTVAITYGHPIGLPRLYLHWGCDRVKIHLKGAIMVAFSTKCKSAFKTMLSLKKYGRSVKFYTRLDFQPFRRII